jgi:hypothetical protein
MSGELVQVNLRRDGRFGLRCPSCGAVMGVNRAKLQTARDLPMGAAMTVMIVYEAIQGHCSACGAWATIHPPGVDDHARATRRLMEFVSRLARHLPLSSVKEVGGGMTRRPTVGTRPSWGASSRRPTWTISASC